MTAMTTVETTVKGNDTFNTNEINIMLKKRLDEAVTPKEKRILRQQFFENNEKICMKVAHNFLSLADEEYMNNNREEIFQTVALTCLENIDKWDYTAGVHFSTYVATAIFHELSKIYRSVHFPELSPYYYHIMMKLQAFMGETGMSLGQFTEKDFFDSLSEKEKKNTSLKAIRYCLRYIVTTPLTRAYSMDPDLVQHHVCAATLSEDSQITKQKDLFDYYFTKEVLSHIKEELQRDVYDAATKQFVIKLSQNKHIAYTQHLRDCGIDATPSNVNRLKWQLLALYANTAYKTGVFTSLEQIKNNLGLFNIPIKYYGILYKAIRPVEKKKSNESKIKNSAVTIHTDKFTNKQPATSQVPEIHNNKSAENIPETARFNARKVLSIWKNN